MNKYIKQFANHTAYLSAESNLDKPNVSLCAQENEVHYNPFVPPFFCKLTLNDDSVIELEGEGELTYAIVSSLYKSTLVSAEIGELCTGIGRNAFYNCSDLTSVTIPDSVTSIGNSAFYGCSSLAEVIIPNSVTSIAESAFAGCSGLTSIIISNSVISIENYTFQLCSGLTEITIPNSVTSIGGYVFTNCSSLTSITIGNSVTSIRGYNFSNCSSLTEIISLATTAPTIISSTFNNIKLNGTLTVPIGSSGYDVWMQKLGSGWTKVEQ